MKRPSRCWLAWHWAHWEPPKPQPAAVADELKARRSCDLAETSITRSSWATLTNLFGIRHIYSAFI